MRSLFFDTAYVVALAIPADQYHERALALAAEFEEERPHMVRTRGGRQRHRSDRHPIKALLPGPLRVEHV